MYLVVFLYFVNFLKGCSKHIVVCHVFGTTISKYFYLFSAVCDIRLDFEQFVTNAPADTAEAGGGLCQDILTITTNTGQAIPEICGTNSGQHGILFDNYHNNLIFKVLYLNKVTKKC